MAIYVSRDLPEKVKLIRTQIFADIRRYLFGSLYLKSLKSAFICVPKLKLLKFAGLQFLREIFNLFSQRAVFFYASFNNTYRVKGCGMIPVEALSYCL